MRTATQWFDLYAESHRHPTNKAIHWVCIPIILVSTLGLLQAIPLGDSVPAEFHLGLLLVAIGLAFYLSLSATIFVGMAFITATALWINHWIVQAEIPLGPVSAVAWIVAWAVQFVGHRIEGKKPSFLQDLQFLLVGPAWLLQFIYRKVGVPVETWRRK